MKYYRASGIILMVLSAGGMTTKASRVVVWETQDIPRTYEVVGPVSVSEQISESTGDRVQGLAGYISKS
ncbi:MAG: hypothetical protein JW893_08965 [Candidatus Omnitrophica bacterium]|nr:hypothetical protein [Candidatus Omnitrophota bacterium]